MQEREGREQGLALTYRLIDADERELRRSTTCPSCSPGRSRLGFDGLNVTHPFKQAVVPLLDELSEDAADLGAVNTVVFRDGRMLGRNTDCSGYGRAFRQLLPDAVGDRVVLVGAGGAGVAVGYGLLRPGRRARGRAGHRPRPRRRVRRAAGQAVRRRPGLASRTTSSAPSATRRAWSTRHRSGCSGTPGSSVPAGWCARTSGSPTSSTSRWRPSWSRWPGPAAAACCPAAAWPCSRRSARSSTSPGGAPTRRRMPRHFGELTA